MEDGVSIGTAVVILLVAYVVCSFIALIFSIPYPW